MLLSKKPKSYLYFCLIVEREEKRRENKGKSNQRFNTGEREGGEKKPKPSSKAIIKLSKNKQQISLLTVQSET